MQASFCSSVGRQRGLLQFVTNQSQPTARRVIFFFSCFMCTGFRVGLKKKKKKRNAALESMEEGAKLGREVGESLWLFSVG